jgi:hypothetical protein
MEAVAWGEVRLVLETDLDQFPWLPHLLGLRVERLVEVLILGIAEEAAGHVQELTDSDVISVGNLGLELTYRVVETQLALLDKLQNDCPGKGLGVAAYAKVIVGRDRGVALQVPCAESLTPRSFTRNIDVDECPRNPQVTHLLFDLWL